MANLTKFGRIVFDAILAAAYEHLPLGTSMSPSSPAVVPVILKAVLRPIQNTGELPKWELTLTDEGGKITIPPTVYAVYSVDYIGGFEDQEESHLCGLFVSEDLAAKYCQFDILNKRAGHYFTRFDIRPIEVIS